REEAHSLASASPRTAQAAPGSGLRALAAGAVLSAALISTLIGGAAYRISSHLGMSQPIASPLKTLSWVSDISLGVAQRETPIATPSPIAVAAVQSESV